MLSTSSSKQRRGEAVPMPPDRGGDDEEEEATGTKGARCTAASPVGLERLGDLLAERSSPVSVERSSGELVSTEFEASLIGFDFVVGPERTLQWGRMILRGACVLQGCAACGTSRL
jgi:hypothetical protein